MTDHLLQPEEVRTLLTWPSLDVIPRQRRLCRDYLTLWDHNKELASKLRAIEKITDIALLSLKP